MSDAWTVISQDTVEGREISSAPQPELQNTLRSSLEKSAMAGIWQRVDPYLLWAVLNGSQGWGPKTDSWAVVIQLDKQVTAQKFAAGQWSDHSEVTAPKDWKAWCQVPDWYGKPPTGIEASTFLTAYIGQRFLQELAQDKTALSKIVRRFSLSWCPKAPQADTQKEQTGQSHGAAGPKSSPKVVVGIIDDGIAFAHRRFRDRHRRSRVLAFWNQLVAAGSPSAQGTGAVPYGREILQGNIDDLLTRHSADAFLDEDALYVEAGQKDVGRRGRHGTHVMDLACGHDPSDSDYAPPIVAVQLPRDVTLNTAGHLLSQPVLDGLRYIVDRASLGSTTNGGGQASPPVVVNLSYGIHGGPHDGSSLLEEGMDELIRLSKGRLAIVIAGGNSQLSRCHATIDLDPNGASKTLRWRVPADHPSPTFLEIWLPHPNSSNPNPEIELTLETPEGSSQLVGPGQLAVYGNPLKPVATMSYHRAQGSLFAKRDMILIALAPTRRMGGADPAAPAGHWTLKFVNNSAVACTVNAWIERTDAPYGFARTGPQSRFEDPAYEAFDSLGRIIEEDPPRPPSAVRRAGTLNGIATGTETIVAGAAAGVSGGISRHPKAARYAASGPGVGSNPRTGPDVASESDAGPAHRGVIAAGTRSAAAVTLDGSSIAAPRVTRSIAARIAANDLTAFGRSDAHALINPPPAQSQAPRLGNGVVKPANDGRSSRLKP